jgi:hypothetical protein
LGVLHSAGVAQLVEHLPSKQDVASSNLVARSNNNKRHNAHVAQW